MSHRDINWTVNQEKALAFETNQCLLAGAGSGKTMTLVELVLRLLQGRVPGLEDGVDLDHILALTFTEKAAGEMRDRVRLALNEEIRSAGADRRDFWARQRRFLDRAQISTIHSFCLHVLRQYGFEAGMDPDFNVLEESRDFQAETRRETLLNWIQSEDHDFLTLLNFFPWLSRGYGQGVDRLLSELIDHTRTYGRKIRSAGSEPGPLKPYFESLVSAANLIDALEGKLNPAAAYYRSVTGFAAEVRKSVKAGRSDKEILADLPQIKGFVKGNWQKAKPARDMAKAALEALNAELARKQAWPIKERLLVLAGKLDLASAQAKAGRFVLDFDDLLLETRNLLAQNPEVRTRLKQRFRVVLVDEFQDTNRLQADILAYLLEPDDQTVLLPPDESALDTLERAPRRLIVFGDPKQSIYRFRGAEVSVFQGLKGSLTDQDRKGAGRVISLKENFRSQKKLIDFYNAFFPTIMKGGAEFAAEYGSQDSQVHRRRNLGAGPGVEILTHEPGGNEVEAREIEAQALALYIKNLLAGLGNVLVTDQARQPEPGDLAVLLRRFTHLRVYEQAFRRAGLPFHTVRGKGFYQCPEVWDLINLLFFLADPNQGPALLGVLRSPLMGLSDETLTRLVQPDENRIDLADYFRPQPPPWPSGVPDDQVSAMNKAQDVLIILSKEAGRAFPAELIETAVEKTDYLAVLLAQHQGDRKAANVQRFIEITRQLPVEALYAPGEMARFLKARLRDSQDDPEAQITLEGAQAIRIMTIHQAKGLEFPVVFVPDAGYRLNLRHKAVLFGADDKFDLTFRDPETGETRTPIDYNLLKDDASAREQAENARLLYVAATRAQDHLIFSGRIKTKNDKGSWLARLTEFAGQRPDLIHIVSNDEMAEEEPEPEREPQKGLIDLPRPGGKAKEILSRVLDRELPQPRNLSLNVTDLSQYLTCPRWFYLEQVIGLPGRPEAEPVSGQSLGLDQRQKGIIFHHLLETMDLGSPPDINSLTDAANQKALTEGWPGQAEGLARLAVQFIKSPWGRELARSRDGWVKRELPLWLKIDPVEPDGPSLTIAGVIDLVYVTPEGLARIVDYKYTAKAEAGRYEAQLKAYALALTKHRLSGKIKVGLYFTHESGSRAVEIPLTPGWAEEFEDQLRHAALDLARVMGPEGLEPVPPAVCPLPGCVLRYACR